MPKRKPNTAAKRKPKIQPPKEGMASASAHKRSSVKPFDTSMLPKSEKSFVDFHYLKGSQFKTIHVDGAFGGPTPGGDISMSVYSERNPIPVLVRHEIDESGKLGKEVAKSVREGIVRELEATLVFDLKTAKAIRTWLDDRIVYLETKGVK